jgi:AcrR family transcriptional regulator
MFVNPRPRGKRVSRENKAPPAAAAPGSADDEEGAARRVPTQERAKKRVERIIDAAALVFAEEGYKAATMEGIAARAETSIGSIYQFYPNKRAVFSALTRHYHDKLRAFFDALVGGPLLERPWSEILEDGIDAFALFHEQDPGFRAVWVGLNFTEEAVTEGEAINLEFARRLEAVLAAKLPGLPPRLRPIAATMVVEVLTGMLIVSARRPHQAKALMTETKALLKRYLAPYEEEAAPKRSKASEQGRAAVRSRR